jgi:vancomycin resistance protein YoaR
MLISVIAAPVVAVAYHALAYAERVYPGVYFHGRDLSGKTAEQVFAIALNQNAYYENASLMIDLGGAVTQHRPVEFGSYADAAAVVKEAWRIGRSGDLRAQVEDRARVYWYGVDVAPVVHLDSAAAAARVAQIAREFDKPVVDADVELDAGSGKVRQQEAQAGIAIDQPAAVRLIEDAIRTRRTEPVVLPTVARAPRIASIGPVAAELEQMIRDDLVVMLPAWDAKGQPQPDVEAFRVPRQDLARYAYVEEVEAADGVSLRVGFRREELQARLQPFSAAITGTLENARYEFDEERRSFKVIKPAMLGRGIDVEGTLDAIETALRTGGERRVTIAVRQVEPTYADRTTAAELGITELITQATTYFSGSSAARIANVRLAASRFHGVIVPPGEVFSFNHFLGNVSKEDGFEEGLIIVGGRTEKGIGGGVCQVSTTAFQAALRAGFPIIERYPHGYRVTYYERGMGAGYDAAVFTPWADMKFRNDASTHLLIETFFDPIKVTLTFKFFGKRDGRVVEIGAPNISQTVPHSADQYEPDPDNTLAPGEVKQVEYAVDGATISFTRRVTRGGSTLIDETISSKYVPWRNVFRFGPGFVVPEGAEVIAPAGAPTPAAPAAAP